MSIRFSIGCIENESKFRPWKTPTLDTRQMKNEAISNVN